MCTIVYTCIHHYTIIVQYPTVPTLLLFWLFLSVLFRLNPLAVDPTGIDRLGHNWKGLFISMPCIGTWILISGMMADWGTRSAQKGLPAGLSMLFGLPPQQDAHPLATPCCACKANNSQLSPGTVLSTSQAGSRGWPSRSGCLSRQAKEIFLQERF